MWWRLLPISLLACITLSCHTATDQSPVVAQVYSHTLHQSDLAGLVPNGISADDSAAIVGNYIEQWIRQTVMLDKAQKNVNENFDRQLNQYRNSLLIYAYEQQIIRQLLDTAVGDDEVLEYYNTHLDEFTLGNSIVKAVYVKVPPKSASAPKIKKLISKPTFQEEDVAELEYLASHNGITGYYDADQWIPFYTLQSAVPIITYNENLYLKQNRFISLSDDSIAYYVRILDYKIADQVSPLELQHDRIKATIINHRKTAILAKLQDDLLAAAESSGNITRLNK